MSTFLKIALGFIIGVIVTLSLVFAVSTPRERTKSSADKFEVSEERQEQDYHSFEISTKDGVITLHTNMHKDSVKILMGRPDLIDVDNLGNNVHEKWEYMGRNSYIPEFTIKFINGELESIDQCRD